MNSYVTGQTIRRLREEKQITQAALAQQLNVSDKAVSKWETGKGYPDITLIEPLSRALGVSAVELLSGEPIVNRNRGFNMKRTRLYVCPLCGNVVAAAGDAVVCCCGITLPPLSEEAADDAHRATVEVVEDDYYITLPHDMTKEHYISFFAALSDNRAEIVKLYPEQNAEARFRRGRTGTIYGYCNRHGLFRIYPEK